MVCPPPLSKILAMPRGVFRGGPLCHGPIFRPKSGEDQKKRSSLKFGPIFHPKPNSNLGIRFDHTKATFWAFLLGFGWKIGPNLSEDLFFFALYLILGEKSDWAGQFDSDLCSSHIFWTFWPPPPPFQNPAYATGYVYVWDPSNIYFLLATLLVIESRLPECKNKNCTFLVFKFKTL